MNISLLKSEKWSGLLFTLLSRIWSCLNLLLNSLIFRGNMIKYVTNKELQNLKEYYSSQYLEVWWNGYTEFASLSLILQIMLILFSQANTFNKSAIVIPLVSLTIVLAVNQIVNKYKILIEYIFIFLTFINRIMITHEGLVYKEYRFHET